MGNSESTESHLAFIQTPTSQSYAPVQTSRTSDRPFFDHLEQPHSSQTNQLLKTAYHGVWSMELPDCVGPAPRLGQCHVFDSENNFLVIAYGLNAHGGELNDAWILELSPLRWRRLSSNLLGPRQYPSSTLIGRQMYVFGGVHDHQFLAELHSIDIDTGVVTEIRTSPYGPSPRICPVLFSTANQLYLWSGYDGSTHGDGYVFDISTGQWAKNKEEIVGRASASFCVYNNEQYVFGASKVHGLMKLNRETNNYEPVLCTGAEPPPELTHSALVPADEFLFLIGGEAEFGYMHLFALEVKRRWWFAFHVRPDRSTLTLADGIVNKIGLFMMPREHSASVVYSKHNRELISVMGSKMMDPPPVFKIAIGEALGSLHIRSDMLEIFDSQVRPGCYQK